MYEYLEGKNIVLRKAKLSDYESMLKHVWGDEEVYSKMLYKPTFTIEDAKERCKRSIEFQKEHYAYFIALKSTDEAIGLCAIDEDEPHVFEECGICIGTAFQGKGYGKEIVALLLDLVFSKLGGEKFIYGYFQDNIKSKRLAESFGFKYYETEKMIRPWDQAEKTIDYCFLTREEWKQKSRL